MPWTIKKSDGTTIITKTFADSNLRKPAQAKRREGQVFEPPDGPFVQYVSTVPAVSAEPIEVRFPVEVVADVSTLRDIAEGVHGDELLLANPYEADIKVAVLPGPEGFEQRRYKGAPGSEESEVIMRFVRV